MPVTIDGAPTHVLIVHFVVVLLPIAILGALVLVAFPSTRRAFSLLTLVIGFLACIAIPLAFLSGSALRYHLPDSPLIARHVTLAHELLPLAAVFGLVLAAFVVLDVLLRTRSDNINDVERRLTRRPQLQEYARSKRLGRLHRATATLLVILALATGIQVYRVGDAGAKASWSGRLTTGQHPRR